MKVTTLSLITLIAVIATSCQSKVLNAGKSELSPEELYNLANKAIKHKKYSHAISTFENIFFRHPVSLVSADAKIMYAYSLYLDGKYHKANDVLDNFIKLYPFHRNIKYARYLKALSLYAQISSIGLDSLITRHAKENLQEIVRLYPGSKYAIDVVPKIKLTNDLLAGHEMLVGRYYLTRKNIVAAIHRFQYVSKIYNSTIYGPEALYRLAECNSMLGLSSESRKYIQVLSHKHPESPWSTLTKNIL